MNTTKQQYVINNDADITALVDRHMDGAQAMAESKDIYLRALWATSQHELGITPPARGKTVRVDDEEKARQLAGVATVHERFYSAARKRVEERLAASGLKGKALADEATKRSNYWRTCVYAIRMYIRSGNSLASLPPARVAKSSIRVQLVSKAPSARRLSNRVEKSSKAFVAHVLALVEVDKDAAAKELDILLGQLAAQRAAIAGAPGKDARQAAAEHRPFRMGSTVFMPTMTQVIRQMERPS